MRKLQESFWANICTAAWFWGVSLIDGPLTGAFFGRFMIVCLGLIVVIAVIRWMVDDIGPARVRRVR